MRLSPPRSGFALAWQGDLGVGNGATRRRPSLDAAVNVAGTPSYEWAPVTPELLDRLHTAIRDL